MAFLATAVAALVVGCAEAPPPLAAGDAAPAPPAAAGAERLRDPVRGIAVSLPPGWTRAARPLTPGLTNPLELLAVGTGPLPAQPRGCNHMPGAALDAMGARGAFLSVQETAPGDRADPRAIARGPARAGVLNLDGPPVRGWACARSTTVRVWWIPFRDGDRAFYALAALGPRALPARRRQLERALASLRFAEGRVAADGGLRLRLPARWASRPAAGRRGPARLRVATRLGGEPLRVTATHLRAERPAPSALADCAGARACAVEQATLRGWRLRVVVAIGWAAATEPGAGAGPDGAARLPPRPDPARDAAALRQASAVLGTLHTEFAWPPPR